MWTCVPCLQNSRPLRIVLYAVSLGLFSLALLLNSGARLDVLGTSVLTDDDKYFLEKEKEVNCRRHEWSNITSDPSLTRAPCYSTALFDVSDVKLGIQTKSKKEGPVFGRAAGSGKVPNIFLLVVESLSLSKFVEDMPLTRKVLDDLDSVWFPNFHHRAGGTRDNLPGLLFGQLPKYDLRVESTMLGPKGSNYSATFNISRKTLSETALWKVAERSGFKTLHGSTACNLLFGLHHISTSHGHVFHDTRQNLTDFAYSFPNGAYYQDKPDLHSCHNYRETREVLRCASTGPYHHKFYEFYKTFSAEVQGSKFTTVHLYEPHGNFIFWTLDFHTSQFIKWLGERKDTMIAFMGDHGDNSGTPLALVFPPELGRDIALLRKYSHTFVLAENVYSFFKNIMQTRDVKKSSVDFLKETFQNRCESTPHLAECHCETENATSRGATLVEFEFDMSFVNSTVDYIQKMSSPPVCQSYELLNYSVPEIQEGTLMQLSFIITFTNTAIYEVMFFSKAEFQVKQLTRYNSQIECTPEGTHARFCICNMTTFREHNDAQGVNQ